jgi:hypothetical protein
MIMFLDRFLTKVRIKMWNIGLLEPPSYYMWEVENALERAFNTSSGNKERMAKLKICSVRIKEIREEKCEPHRDFLITYDELKYIILKGERG